MKYFMSNVNLIKRLEPVYILLYTLELEPEPKPIQIKIKNKYHILTIYPLKPSPKGGARLGFPYSGINKKLKTN